MTTATHFSTITGEDWRHSLTRARQRFSTTSDRIRSQIPPAQKTMRKPTPRPTNEQKWGHMREACVKALRANWSVGACVRAYGVTEAVIRKWQSEEGIPPYTGPKRPMPEVGQILA